ncbi:MAG: hypothetical protein WBN48_05775, partial [Thiogranum sp.]
SVTTFDEVFDMPHLITLDELKQHVTLLASVEESDAPFISCYLNLEDEPDSCLWRISKYQGKTIT